MSMPSVLIETGKRDIYNSIIFLFCCTFGESFDNLNVDGFHTYLSIDAL